MPTAKHRTPKTGLSSLLFVYVFGLVIFFFGFTDLPRMKEEAYPLFGAFLLLLGIPAFIQRERPPA
jgi:hypothetical protein